MSKNNDFDVDFEAELEESIAQIIDEETTGAEEYVRTNNLNKSVRKAKPLVEEIDDEEDEEDAPKKSFPLYVLFIILGVVAVGIIVAAILIGKSCVSNSIKQQQDTYSYYNQEGYKAYDAKDYAEAIVLFEKALTYDEGQTDTTMRLYLYDCYVATNAKEEARAVLEKVIGMDTTSDKNLDLKSDAGIAFTLLMKDYDTNQDYESIRTMYEKYKNNENTEVVASFNKYLATEPELLKAAGNYTVDIEVGFKKKEGVTIYFTKNGENPTTSGTLYESSVAMSEGSLTLKYYAVNEYGFKTDVLEAKYTVSYEAPDAAVVSPSSGSYETTASQYVTISNVPVGCKAYYTIDGTTPTSGSKLYAGPFELKEGNTTVKVIVYNENGMSSSVITATYTIKKIDLYTDDECQEMVWDQLYKHKYIANKTKHTTSDGKKYELEYYSHQNIKTSTYYIYKVLIDGKKQSYYICCDCNEKNKIYLATKNGDDFNLSTLNDYVEPEPEPSSAVEEETTAAETETSAESSNE